MALLQRSKGSNAPATGAPASAVFQAPDRRQSGPGGGYWWGAGPKTFVPMSRGPQQTITELGRPGDFVEGEHAPVPPGVQGFPYATPWPGYPGASTGWEPPFYEAGSGAYGGRGPGGAFLGGAMLESRVSTVFTCIDLISRSLSTMQFRITENSAPIIGPEWTRNPEPAVYSSVVDAVKALINSYYVRGEAILTATARYPDNGRVARWVVLNPDYVTIEVDSGSLPRYYLNGYGEIPREDICHIRYQVWPGEPHGVGPLEAVARNVMSATALEAWGTALAVNNGIPTAVLQAAVKLTKDQTDALKTSWREAMATRGILPVILSGGLTYTPLNLKPSEVGLLDLRTFDEQRIAAALGVPSWLVGLPVKDGLTYTTVAGTFDYFWRATLRAAAYNMTQALSDWALGPDQWARVDDEAFTRGDLLARSQAYKILVELGAFSPEEVRIAESFAPKPPTQSPGDKDLEVLAKVTDGGV